METAGWIRLGIVVLVAIVVVVLLFRRSVFRRRQLGDARENEYAMSGRPHEQDSHAGGHGGGHHGGSD